MSSIAIQVLTKLDRGMITVDEAERMILAIGRKGWPIIHGGFNVSRPKRWTAVEIPTPTTVTLQTMFAGESSSLWM